MANYIHVPEEAPAVPKIDVTLDESDYRSGALRLIRELRPSWKPSEVQIKVRLTAVKLSVICGGLNAYVPLVIAALMLRNRSASAQPLAE